MARSPIDRLRTVCLSLPEASEKTSHGEPTFWVRKRMFAMFADADNHHGGGRYAVWCKATHMTQNLLVSRSPDRYFVPPYRQTLTDMRQVGFAAYGRRQFLPYLRATIHQFSPQRRTLTERLLDRLGTRG